MGQIKGERVLCSSLGKQRRPECAKQICQFSLCHLLHGKTLLIIYYTVVFCSINRRVRGAVCHYKDLSHVNLGYLMRCCLISPYLFLCLSTSLRKKKELLTLLWWHRKQHCVVYIYSYIIPTVMMNVLGSKRKNIHNFTSKYHTRLIQWIFESCLKSISVQLYEKPLSSIPSIALHIQYILYRYN